MNGEILIVDDSRLHRAMIRGILESASYTVTEAADGPSALATLNQRLPDLIILDWIMPDMSGIQVMQRIRSDPFLQSIPILLLTVRDTRFDKVEALSLGADAYLTKPFYPEELIAEVEALLRRSFNYHPLTRLPAASLIRAEVERALNDEAPVVFAYVDIDDFKAFNDRYGTPRGDDVIRFLADVIQAAVKDMGEPRVFVGHIGGDDFLLISPPTAIEPLAHRIIAAFERGIPAFYADEDRARGYIEIPDRRGRGALQRRPFMTLSIAAVPRTPELTSHSQVGQKLAELKARAKREPGSTFLLEEGGQRLAQAEIEQKRRDDSDARDAP